MPANSASASYHSLYSELAVIQPALFERRLIAAALEPGATILGVARTFGVHACQVFRWRQQLCRKAAAGPGSAAVAIATEPSEAALGRGGSIEVELGPEVRIRISGAADAATVSAVLAALKEGSR